MSHTLIARAEKWPLSRPFRIARGVKNAAEVVVVEAHDGAHVGFGEAVPYARYGESVDDVLAQIAGVEPGMSREVLQRALPAGAARNAVDCALWDLEAKRSGRTVASRAGVREPSETITAITISLDDPALMAEAAAAVADAPLLKVKVNADDPVRRVTAVRQAAPRARLIVDPNESWTFDVLVRALPALVDMNVALIEQPLPAAEDAALETLNPPVPICADESAHVTADLERTARLYQAVNIKLDKAGGLTEALAMRQRAEALGLTIMIGCMVCTSLSIAPAMLLTDGAGFVDLDGPWWLARDRDDAARIAQGRIDVSAMRWGRPL